MQAQEWYQSPHRTLSRLFPKLLNWDCSWASDVTETLCHHRFNKSTSTFLHVAWKICDADMKDATVSWKCETGKKNRDCLFVGTVSSENVFAGYTKCCLQTRAVNSANHNNSILGLWVRGCSFFFFPRHVVNVASLLFSCIFWCLVPSDSTASHTGICCFRPRSIKVALRPQFEDRLLEQLLLRQGPRDVHYFDRSFVVCVYQSGPASISPWLSHTGTLFLHSAQPEIRLARR